jgi:hypothetical protein
MAVATTPQAWFTSKSIWNQIGTWLGNAITLLVGVGLLHWTAAQIATVMALWSLLMGMLAIWFRWTADQPLTTDSSAPALPPAPQIIPTLPPVRPPTTSATRCPGGPPMTKRNPLVAALLILTLGILAGAAGCATTGTTTASVEARINADLMLVQSALNVAAPLAKTPAEKAALAKLTADFKKDAKANSDYLKTVAAGTPLDPATLVAEVSALVLDAEGLVAAFTSKAAAAPGK